MRKRVLTLAVIAVLAALAFPVSNLIFKPEVSTKLTDAKKDEPLFTQAATVLQKKCMSCHSAGVPLPFYAGLPIAESMIQKDIEDGLAYYDFLAALLPAGNKPVGEVALAKLEHSVSYGSMPPGRYLLLHWDGGLDAAEKDAVLKWVGDVRAKNYATAGTPAEAQKSVLQPLPASISLNAAKVALGRKLYHDKRLSGDDTIACATCHDLARGGTDQQQFSTGIGGKKGDINSPTSYNSGFNFVQFWDGRAADLAAQAAGPVTNPVEMGANWPQVVEKLDKDEALRAEFIALYPDGFSEKTITDAIAEFEKSLVTPNSRFDRFLLGDAGALSAEEKEGYDLFTSHACSTCHVGKAVGGQSYEKMGLKRDYFADRGNVHKPDFGRFNVTKDEKDKHTFKVPLLRNITLTGPYFHDGSTTDLTAAVKTMSRYQRADDFTDAEAESVVAFLKTLTGEYEGKLLE